MALTSLPEELINEIIECSLPEGFESLAMTCKSIYGLCEPFIKPHNNLCRRYQKFRHMEVEFPGIPPEKAWCLKEDDPRHPVRTALDLIKRIAIEPKVAYYIEAADLERDSWPYRCRTPQIFPGIDLGGPLIELFASSPHLKRAGLDWKEYYAAIEQECENRPDYSQHATVFLLTLLPNIKILMLPRLWKTTEATDRLLDVIIQDTKLQHSFSNTPSLAQVTRVGWTRELECLDMECSSRFLTLPLARHFMGTGFSKLASGHIESVSPGPGGPYHTLGKDLETINLKRCCLGEREIGHLLKHTPHLKTLFYSHFNRRFDNWDICTFLSEIEREVGGHLNELCISIERMAGSILLGKACTRGFRVLRRLQLPLETALCAAGCKTIVPWRGISTTALINIAKDGALFLVNIADDNVVSLSDIVPPLVSELVLTVDHLNDAKWRTFELLFHDFATHKEMKLSALNNIQLSGMGLIAKGYEEKCASLAEEIKQVDTHVHMTPYPVIEWEGKWRGIKFPPRPQKIWDEDEKCWKDPPRPDIGC